MNFKDFKRNYSFKSEMDQIIELSNLAYKNWEIYWSNFFSSYVYDDILNELGNLSDLSFFVYGGYTNSERAKIACYRNSLAIERNDLLSDFSGEGIEIKGNFLFDNATQDDFRDLLINEGISRENIGDIWTIGDRGAQGVISLPNKDFFKQKNYFLRDVEVQIKIINLNELKTPLERIEKIINTIEASLRLDAIASAGFRISRSKISEKIQNGLISMNGNKVNKSTLILKVGDRIKFENKGMIEILEIYKTKRERWKVKLLKK